MKKKLTVLAVLALCLGLAATGTWAYFTAQKQVHNVITTGKVDIRLLEWADADRTQPFENLTGIMPGMEVTKIAEVKNTGTAPAFIRVQVVVDVYSAEGNALDSAPVKLDFNQTDWIYNEGYYYYNRILNPSETTEPLFTTVSFDVFMGDAYQEGTTYVNVHAGAVQSANNGEDPLQATGWPSFAPPEPTIVPLNPGA